MLLGRGYDRFWVAEHHAVPGIASGAPAVLGSAVTGGPATVRRRLEQLVASTGPDEVMSSASAYDREALFASDAMLLDLVD